MEKFNKAAAMRKESELYRQLGFKAKGLGVNFKGENLTITKEGVNTYFRLVNIKKTGLPLHLGNYKLYINGKLEKRFYSVHNALGYILENSFPDLVYELEEFERGLDWTY